MFLFFFLSFFFNIFHLIFSSPSDLADETARTATPKKAEKESVPGIFIFKRKEKHFKKEKEREVEMDWSLRLLSNIMCSAGSFLFHRWLYGAADASALCLSGEPARSPFFPIKTDVSVLLDASFLACILVRFITRLVKHSIFEVTTYINAVTRQTNTLFRLF